MTPPAATPIRVFVVDDHEVVREGLVRMLSRLPDIEIVGTAGSGEEAIEKVPYLAPNVVLLDLRLPGVQGLEVLRTLMTLTDPPRVLVLTVHDDEDLVLGASRLGAMGYVLKNTSRSELATAIRRVAAGGHYFGEEVIATVLRGARQEALAEPLTERELQILRLVTDGLSNKDVGERLYLSPDTVKSHLVNVYRKLGVESRAHAVAVAIRRGLVE